MTFIYPRESAHKAFGARLCSDYKSTIKRAPQKPLSSVTDENARLRMVSSFDLDNTRPDWALCYRYNIVLRGRNATPLETHQ